MNRRGFLKSIIAAGAAPAFIGSSVLMPLTKILSADGVSFLQSGTGFVQLAYAAVLHGDGIRDDTAAMQAFLDGLPVMFNGRVVQITRTRTTARTAPSICASAGIERCRTLLGG